MTAEIRSIRRSLRLVGAGFLTVTLWLWSAAVSQSYAICTTYHDVNPSFLSHKMDGDTIAVKHLGPMLLKFRVKDVDTAERSDTRRWTEAREYTWAWLHHAPFTIYTCWKPTLDRYEAVISRGDVTLANELRARGFQK